MVRATGPIFNYEAEWNRTDISLRTFLFTFENNDNVNFEMFLGGGIWEKLRGKP